MTTISYSHHSANPVLAADHVVKSDLPLTVKTALAGLIAHLGESNGDSVVVNATGSLSPRGCSVSMGARYSAPLAEPAKPKPN